jgi:hypothetical protein
MQISTTGSTRWIDVKRGRYSFVPADQYEWSTKNEVAEVTVPERVSDVLGFVNRAVVIEPDGREIVRFP